jgi:hypothetical protein
VVTDGQLRLTPGATVVVRAGLSAPAGAGAPAKAAGGPEAGAASPGKPR